MAETSTHHQSIEEPEEPAEVSSTERDQWESTELSELDYIRQNYTHASSSHASAPGSSAPTGFFGQLTYNVSKFWRHQISVTVDHVACRDHLGMYHYYFLSFYRSCIKICQVQGMLAIMRSGDLGPKNFCRVGCTCFCIF